MLPGTANKGSNSKLTDNDSTFGRPPLARFSFGQKSTSTVARHIEKERSMTNHEQPTTKKGHDCIHLRRVGAALVCAGPCQSGVGENRIILQVPMDVEWAYR